MMRMCVVRKIGTAAHLSVECRQIYPTLVLNTINSVMNSSLECSSMCIDVMMYFKSTVICICRMFCVLPSLEFNVCV